MLYRNCILLGEIAYEKIGRYHGVHIVTLSNIYMADLGIKCEPLSRYLMFYGSVYTNRNTKVCAELCELSNTPAASNRRLLMAQLNIDRLCFQHSSCIMHKNKLMDTFMCKQLAVNIGNVIRELCLVRDNELSCELSPINVIAIINLCLN